MEDCLSSLSHNLLSFRTVSCNKTYTNGIVSVTIKVKLKFYLNIRARYPLEVRFLWYLIMLPASWLYVILPVHNSQLLTKASCFVTIDKLLLLYSWLMCNAEKTHLGRVNCFPDCCIVQPCGCNLVILIVLELVTC